MTVSLDGFIAGPGGNIDWSVPTEELHQFHNERVAALGGHFLGRRLYETMLYWETAESDWGEIEHEFARIWNPLPKVVFSSTLEQVEGNARLATDGIAEEVARLKEETEGDLGVGGATLAAAFTELGLVDEYELFVAPVLLGAGTPYFGPASARIDLELVERRNFGEVVYLHYRRR
jgi:dihydrofolate reductase